MCISLTPIPGLRKEAMGEGDWRILRNVMECVGQSKAGMVRVLGKYVTIK